MMRLSFNHKDKTIEMPTKKYETAASKYGTDEYIEVQNARRDYPNYRVVRRNRKIKKNDTIKGLTYEVMEKYIKSHDKENSIKNHYDFLRGKADGSVCSASYGEIKKWFLSTFKEFGKFPTNTTSTAIAQ